MVVSSIVASILVDNQTFAYMNVEESSSNLLAFLAKKDVTSNERHFRLLGIL